MRVLKKDVLRAVDNPDAIYHAHVACDITISKKKCSSVPGLRMSPEARIILERQRETLTVGELVMLCLGFITICTFDQLRCDDPKAKLLKDKKYLDYLSCFVAELYYADKTDEEIREATRKEVQDKFPAYFDVNNI